MVEGLSDSTIYMAYYTVAHFLHSDIYGKQPGIANISVAQMTDSVWEYIFALTDRVQSDIPQATLDAMRREFTYWYPVDVRVSGNDLVNNHLVFFLYIHQAIWGIRLNGHLMLNGDKMSKSTGNFLTLTSAVQKFGADATRIALADGGDGIDDCNFEETTANATILKLFELKRWMENVIQHARLLKPEEEFGQVRAAEKLETVDAIQRTGPMTFWDSLFMNDMNTLIRQTVQAYKLTNFKAALKSGFYDLTAARDSYRAATHSASIGMHHECVRSYVKSQALMVCIFAPHWADYIWREVLLKPSTIQLSRFPTPTTTTSSPNLQATSAYIKTTTARILAAHAGQQKRLSKGKGGLQFDPTQATRLTIYVATSWPPWQQRYVDLVRAARRDGGGAALLDAKSVAGMVGGAEMRRAMPFIQELKRKLEEAGDGHAGAVLDRVLGFDEAAVLGEMVPVLKATVARLGEVRVVVVDDDDEEGAVAVPQFAGSAEPGNPAIEFFNV
ncbi:hypothetical protein NEMBOFW57_003269 [Staphylotrichum longicolle]|uniref:Leucine--tRNA ligase n=1 Tax=Staphylotrichum longicolle TaxID=669026 RepID=A0AAD4I5J6_9PEZI|nr:hypothetical protein NEMBOFW57_003269 [Staphylotrichum longicolle]